jgi:hypothetical protein
MYFNCITKVKKHGGQGVLDLFVQEDLEFCTGINSRILKATM